MAAATAKAEAGEFDTADSAMEWLDRHFDEIAERNRAVLMKQLEQGWARDRQPVATRPAVKSAPVAGAAGGALGVAPEVLRGLPGKGLKSDEVRRLVASLPATPEVRESREYGGAWVESPECGISIGFRAAGEARVVASVELFAEGVHGNAQYAGRLPHGLSWSDGRGDVERKVGRPPTSWGGGDRPLETTYRHLGVRFSFEAGPPRNPGLRLRSMFLSEPKAEAEPKAEDGEPATRPATAPAKGPATAPGKGPRVAFRLVEEGRAGGGAVGAADVEQLPAPAEQGERKTLPVRREVLLDESMIEQVSPTRLEEDSSRIALGITLTPEGGKRMVEASQRWPGRRVAVVVDGVVLVAAVINPGVSEELIIDLGDAGEEAVRSDMAGRLHAAAFALPERPSPGVP
jgi:hypothetical protein